MQVLAILNQWFDPTYYDHWQLSNRTTRLGLKRTPLMENSKFYQVIQMYISKSQRGHDWLGFCTAPIRLLAFNLDYTTYWLQQKGDYISCKGESLLGARFTGKLVIGARRFGSDLRYHRIELEPFMLEYPYSMVFFDPWLIERPADLEFLWAWSGSKGVQRMDREIHWEKWRQVLQEIKWTSTS